VVIPNRVTTIGDDVFAGCGCPENIFRAGTTLVNCVPWFPSASPIISMPTEAPTASPTTSTTATTKTLLALVGIGAIVLVLSGFACWGSRRHRASKRRGVVLARAAVNNDDGGGDAIPLHSLSDTAHGAADRNTHTDG